MRICFFDCETTGLLPASVLPLEKQPRCIEICIIQTDIDNKETTFETLIDPEIPISKTITRITGISQRDLEGKPKFGETVKHIKKLIEGSHAVVAHNLSFDKRLIEMEFARLGESINWPRKQYCTVEATEHVRGYRLSLAQLFKFCTGEEMGKAHRATDDVQSLIVCFKKLRENGFV